MNHVSQHTTKGIFLETKCLEYFPYMLAFFQLYFTKQITSCLSLDHLIFLSFSGQLILCMKQFMTRLGVVDACATLWWIFAQNYIAQYTECVASTSLTSSLSSNMPWFTCIGICPYMLGAVNAPSPPWNMCYLTVLYMVTPVSSCCGPTRSKFIPVSCACVLTKRGVTWIGV